MTINPTSLRVTIGTAELPATAVSRLLSLDVRTSLRATGSARLELHELGHALLDADDLSSVEVGKDLRIELAVEPARYVTVFDGQVTGVGARLEASDEGGTGVVEIVGHDRSHALRRGSAVTTWIDQDAAGIIASVAGRHGLTPSCTGTSSTMPFVLQTGSDAELLDQLCQRFGWDWWVSGTTLHAAQRVTGAAAVTLHRGSGLTEFEVAFDGRDLPQQVVSPGIVTEAAATQSDRVFASASAIGTNTPSGATPLPTDTLHASLGTTTAFLVGQATAAADAFKVARRVRGPAASDEQLADAQAASAHGWMLRSGLHVRAVAYGAVTAAPGTWATLEGLGTRLSGDYFVTDVRHHVAAGDVLRTELRCVPPEAATTAGGASSVTDTRVAPGGSSWSAAGPVRGIVTNVVDEQKQGRVQVQLPGLGDEAVTTWAQVASLGAGPTRGLDLLPEVDDAVLVAFENGDPARAFVVGALWDEARPYPDELESNRRVSWRGPNGARLTFHDSDDDTSWTGYDGVGAVTFGGATDRAGSLTLIGPTTSSSEPGAGVLLGSALEVFAGERDLILGTANGSIVIKANGDIEVNGANLAVTAEQKVEVTAGSDLTLDGNQTKISGTASMDLETKKATFKALAGLDLKSSKVGIAP